MLWQQLERMLPSLRGRLRLREGAGWLPALLARSGLANQLPAQQAGKDMPSERADRAAQEQEPLSNQTLEDRITRK